MSSARSAGGPRSRWGSGARLAVLALLPAIVAGCLSFEEPTPTPAPATPRPTATPSVAPRGDATLVVGVPGDPTGFLPPASDPAAELLISVLYDPMYRLDESLTPQPELARALPLITGGGLSWSMPLASPDLRFQDGTPLRSGDVVFSLLLARSPACPLGRDLCDAVARHLDDALAPEPDRVALTLLEPYSPFLAEVLGRLPIVSEAAVRAGAAAIVAGAGPLAPTAPDAQVARIAELTNREACLGDAPPFGCRLADHVADLERTLTSVGLALPSRAIWTDVTGTFDDEAYAGALLDRVAALGRVLSGSEMDQLAASLVLIDPVARPLGSGPFRLEAVIRGTGASLGANPDHVGGAPAIERIELRVVPDAAVATTLLATGELDWLPQVSADGLALLGGVDGVHAGERPLPIQRTIVFNTRPGRMYEDPRVRRAFALCLDRDALVEEATGGAAIPASGWSSAGSWAFPPGVPPPADPAAGMALLDAAGWPVGVDGIRHRGGTRLSSEIAIRPSRTDMLTFARSAAVSLAACGIELLVRDLDLTGDLMVRQLQWPNPFDTVLMTRILGVDPDHDMEAYSTEHATSESNPADANPGGYSSATADALIAEARAAITEAARAEVYGRLDATLDADQPAWPVWFDAAAAGISDRVRAGDAPLDPTRPRYDWDVASWSLRPHP